MTRLLFLPGAGGSPDFWRSAGDRLPGDWSLEYLAWPGLGDQTPDDDVGGLDDLVRLTLERLEEPACLVAQSMGGIVALRCALERPHAVRGLVLTGTSGGLDVESLDGADWRTDYRREFPGAAPWILQAREDLTGRLGSVTATALLVWGDADPISPTAVGRRLEKLLPYSRLEIVPGGAHDFPVTHAARTAELITAFVAGDLTLPPPSPFGF